MAKLCQGMESDGRMDPERQFGSPEDPPPVAQAGDRPVYYARVVAFGPTAVPKEYPELALARRPALVDVVIAVGLFLAMFFTPQAGELIHYVAARMPEYGMLWSNVIIGSASIGIVVLILVLRRHRPSSIGLNRIRWMTVAAAIAAVPACYIAMFATGMIYLLFQFLFTGLDFDSVIHEKQALLDLLPQFSITTMLLFGLLTGFHEELLFRGLLLTRFNAIFRNRAVAVVVCAILFGLVHTYQGFMGVLQTAAIGLALGTITTLSRSLWPAIVGHAIFNSIQLALLPFIKMYIDSVSEGVTSMPAG